ncbi:MAG TPA: sigma-54 dependent transcriptional regulator [Candidatus Acidoferrum sp.]|jgi:DNA-binding NtrC family response regulator|nr:sigma-54 dependent transcriptional regulator [Candidatus Acidoferrum sp.]
MSAMTAFPIAARCAGGALIASSSSALRERVLQSLNGRWRPVQHAVGGADALVKLGKGEWQVLFLDRRLPDLDSAELMAIVERRFPGIQVVLVDSAATLPAEEAEATGKKDPENEDRDAGAACGNEPENAWRAAEGKEHEKEHEYEPLPGMIGRSQAMQRVYRLAQLVAPRTTTVLIVGPTGTGKELVARALHVLSPRSTRPFVAVNCAAIPEALLESELFGHARGAFTGAVQAQVGRIPAAHGGTLFLDEVSELPFGMQAKLLRFLEQKEVQRLGTAETTRVDVRVIAASNVDLAGRAGRGEFREDLFYRLSAFPLELPPLTERRVDIVPLAEHFLACMAAAMSAPCPRLSEEAVRILEAHPWKGNVRELQHVMERASILVESGDTVLSEHLYFPFQQTLFPTARTLSCASLAS